MTFHPLLLPLLLHTPCSCCFLQLLQYHIVPAGISNIMQTALTGASPLTLTTSANGVDMVQPVNDPDSAAQIFPETDLWAGDTLVMMIDKVLIPASQRTTAG
jgi:hypothetical protein